MEIEIKKLKELGANVQEVKGGLKLIGNWDDSYNEFHNLFTEITGELYTSYSIKHPDFLKNLSTLGGLNTYNSAQHPDFLKNLSTLGVLYTSYSIQHHDFLKNLSTLGVLYTSNVVQNSDFLKNLSTLGRLNTYNSIQHPDFLKNLSTLGRLNTYNSAQNSDFLKNLSVLGRLNTYNSAQNSDFLKNLSVLGELDTTYSVQHPNFLKNVKRTFELPYLYKDEILSFVHSIKVIDAITIYKTNRIGYTNTEYVAIKGDLSAHADSLKLALIDLRFKESNRDTTWLEDKTLESTLSFEDSVLAYRCITGACSGGVSHFLKTIKEKQEYKIGKIIDLTKGEYGNESFSKFFKKN